MKKYLIIIAIVAAVGFVIFSGGAPEQVGEETSVDRVSEETHATGEIKEFIIEGRNFEFSQKELTVSRGDTVRIVFRSAQGFHDWRVDGFNKATRRVGEGQESTLEFVADQAGTFEYFCSVGNHRALGMVGTLTVTE